MFGLVAGLLIGALVATVAIPRRQPTSVVASGRAPAQTSAIGGIANGEEAAPGDAQSATGGGGIAAGGSGGSGRRGSGSGGSGSGAASPDGRGPGGNSRGVTDSTVKIGIAYPDLTGLRTLGPEYDNGDVPEQWRALLDGYKRDKKVPAGGRNIEFVFRTYNVLDPGAQRSACLGFVQDDKVFAVVGVAYFQVGSECVAREYRTPLLTTDGPSDAVFARSAPNLFSLQVSTNRLVRNFVRWAKNRGTIAGKKVGVYYLNDAPTTDIFKTIKSELASVGVTDVVEATTDQSLGGPGDALAVQRFRTAQVDVVILLTSKGGFLQQAQGQGYKPTYIESDYLFGTSDVSASTYDKNQWNDTLAMTTTHNGEAAAGEPATAESEKCIGNYERYSGKKVVRPGPNGSNGATFGYVRYSCDLGRVVLHSLNAAGRDLTQASFIAGLESFRDQPTLQFGAVSFGPGRHDGAQLQRTLKWSAACTCWRATGAFAPLFLP
ncbi:MAG: hypothetical protein H0U92_05790 [Actinobacteria bacterium]|nr:hypothetical protein [Actinomycetota bacterium]